jgi:nucleotide-binding universal stress UspA family protein
MFDSILVPLDGSLLAECVLPHACAIAQAFDAQINLVRVLDHTQATETTQLFDLVNWQINKTGAKLYLDRTSSQLQKAGLRVNTMLIEGLVADSITTFAESQDAKLIILSSHGRSGYSQWGISSVTQKVIFSAPTSVLIVRAQQPAPLEEEVKVKRFDHILVPLDGSRRAEIVLPMIALFARFHQSRIHIAHVVKAPEMARQLPVAREDQELADRIVSRNREEAVRYLDQVRLQSQLDGIEVKTHLLIDANPAAALHELIDQEKIDLVALSAHGYTGNSQWPYGGIVNNFILYSKVPLLIVQDLPFKIESLATDVVPRKLTEH